MGHREVLKNAPLKDPGSDTPDNPRLSPSSIGPDALPSPYRSCPPLPFFLSVLQCSLTFLSSFWSSAIADCQRNADNWTVLQFWAETLALLLLTIHNQLNQRFLKAATVHPTLPADRCFIEVEKRKTQHEGTCGLSWPISPGSSKMGTCLDNDHICLPPRRAV